MNDTLRIFLPFLRVQLFGGVVWLLARAGLPAEHAAVITDWLVGGLTIGYGVYASWRESKANLVARTAALPDVKTVVVATNDLALKVGGGLPVKVG